MELLNKEQLKAHFKTNLNRPVGNDTINMMIIKGLPYITIGKRKFFDASTVETWLKSKEETVTFRPRR